MREEKEVEEERFLEIYMIFSQIKREKYLQLWFFTLLLTPFRYNETRKKSSKRTSASFILSLRVLFLLCYVFILWFVFKISKEHSDWLASNEYGNYGEIENEQSDNNVYIV